VFAGGTYPGPDDPADPQLDRGMAVLYEREVLLSRAAWYLTLDVKIAEYTRAISELTQSLDELLVYAGREPTLRQELRYLRAISGELQGKVESITQLLPKEQRRKRGVSAIGGRVLKFLFGTALNEDLANVNSQIDSLLEKLGDVVHDAAHKRP
jgi:glutamine synthetase adenylyltransferase